MHNVAQDKSTSARTFLDVSRECASKRDIVACNVQHSRPRGTTNAFFVRTKVDTRARWNLIWQGAPFNSRFGLMGRKRAFAGRKKQKIKTMALSITKYFSVYLYRSITLRDTFFIKRGFVIRNSSEISDGDATDTVIYNHSLLLQNARYVDWVPFNRNTTRLNTAFAF